MTIYGVALLAACTLAGAIVGDLLGLAIGVKANVGGVGFSMLLLIGVRVWLQRREQLAPATKGGIEFWNLMYIPIVVAMAAQQNVVAAIQGGPVVLIAGIATVILSFAALPLLMRLMPGRDGVAS